MTYAQAVRRHRKRRVQWEPKPPLFAKYIEWMRSGLGRCGNCGAYVPRDDLAIVRNNRDQTSFDCCPECRARLCPFSTQAGAE